MSLIMSIHGNGGASLAGDIPVVLPAGTIRCKFASGYTPTMGDTQTLVDAGENIWDIYKSGTALISLFSSNSSLLEVIAANTTGVTNMNSMFQSCSNLTTVNLFDTLSVVNMANMFQSCSSLNNLPRFNTLNVRGMASMLSGCTSLTAIPLFNTSSVTNMNSMVYGCVNVQSGALALYQQASGQSAPPTNHSYTFYSCGENTVTGAAELAQIPTSWGGTMTEGFDGVLG